MTVHYVFRLIPPRPTFAEDMTHEERAIMGRHAAHWQAQIDAGKMVVFGPVAGESGSWGLGVLEADDEATALELTRTDPVVMAGIGRYEVARMLAGFVRPA